jgi:hypothetical protein
MRYAVITRHWVSSKRDSFAGCSKVAASAYYGVKRPVS